ncbi:hypothetical protein D9758_000593 [Tetrapyrgos nigripes]|uniref:Chromosome segregation in meiosis protein n=1 Tax=Tetrapyrgos nigripes TaxID=182062 RepID=A0A8H5LXU6_9AGAR|nr:hypothetical protein D9758_000593 [Tetrapyrgos nigripes]
MSTAEPLFLPDIDDDSQNPPPQDIDIDEIFKDLEDDDLFNLPAPSRQAFDVEAVKRKADAEYKRSAAAAKLSTPRPILPSSSPPRDLGDGVGTVGGKGQSGAGKTSKDGEPKERRKPMRLDEARLIGPTGFPQLIQSTKNFRIKGKGHEATDLNRLMQIYQYWTHSMYPKSQFRDTVERVEKLCHSKRMHNKLGMWRDEANGIKPQEESEEEVIDLTEQAEQEETRTPASDAADYTSSSPIPTRPPTSPDISGRSDVDDEALDAAMRDLDEVFHATRNTQGASATTESTNVSQTITDKQKSTQASADMNVDDEELWASLGDFDGADFGDGAAVPKSAPGTGKNSDWEEMDNEDLMAAFDDAHQDAPKTGTLAAPKNMLDDEDMWDLVREAEMEETGTKSGPAPATTKRPLSVDEDPDMDDFYEDG